jgi:hypothetical protein
MEYIIDNCTDSMILVYGSHAPFPQFSQWQDNQLRGCRRRHDLFKRRVPRSNGGQERRLLHSQRCSLCRLLM